jgi:hypothetical protein
MKSFIICTLHQIFLGQLIKNGEMDEACSTHGRYEKYKQNSGRET